MKRDIQFASFEAIQKVVKDKQFTAFVWPDEGSFNGNGTWTFNKEHTKQGSDGINYEPLLIDMQTAGVIIALHTALNDTNKAKVESWIKNHRGTFGRIIEIAWEAQSRPTDAAA